jgi:hypothetical protein
MIELNLFKSIPPSQDEKILRQERYTTRIYLILLLLTVIILVLFTSIRPQSIRVIIKSPSLTEFNQLYNQYPVTLNCPCNKPAIDKQFICHMKPQYHEVCLSEFVSEPETKRIFDEAPRFASSWTEARRGEAGFLIISRSEARRGTILNHQSKRGEVRRE